MKLLLITLASLVMANGIVLRIVCTQEQRDNFALAVIYITCAVAALTAFGYALGCLIKYFNP